MHIEPCVGCVGENPPTRQKSHLHNFSTHPERPTMPRKTAKKQPDLLDQFPTPPPGTPEWIRHEQNTQPNPRQARQAHINTCTRCGALILTGLTGPTTAMPTQADPTTTTNPATIRATLHQGRRAYQLETTDTALHLNELCAPPAAGTTVAPHHICHFTAPGYTPLLNQRKDTTTNDIPPF